MPTSPNQESRHGAKIDSIVLHSTAGGYAGSVSWLCNPTAKASAHYVIGRDGQHVNIVPEEQAAWHVRQNVGNWNMRSIGIELVDDNIRDKSWYTQKQKDILVMLVSRLVRDYGIPLNRDAIKMHKELDAKSDPWGWSDNDMDQFIADVHNHLYPIQPPIPEEVLDMTADEYRKVQTLLEYLKNFKFSFGRWLKNDNGTMREMDEDGKVVQSFGTPEEMNAAGWWFGDER